MVPVLKAVSMPAHLMFAPQNATVGAMGAGMMIWVFCGDPIIAFAIAAALWLAGVMYGFKDPHFMEVFLAQYRFRKTRNLHPHKGSYYAA